jgi:cysteine-rich secretory family protein
VHNPSDTKVRLWTGMFFVLIGLSGASWPAAVGARTGDSDSESRAAEFGKSSKAKQWVWLKSQSCWGYGYQREDGFWVIDPGTKRPPTASEGDPYGFLAWLNSTRASWGLPAVGYDQNLTNWAAMNNAQQQVRGLGHHLMGPARRQNAAVGNAASIGFQWMSSPAHRAALLDPTIRYIGIAGLGVYWTFNAY